MLPTEVFDYLDGIERKRGPGSVRWKAGNDIVERLVQIPGHPPAGELPVADGVPAKTEVTVVGREPAGQHESGERVVTAIILG